MSQFSTFLSSDIQSSPYERGESDSEELDEPLKRLHSAAPHECELHFHSIRQPEHENDFHHSIALHLEGDD